MMFLRLYRDHGRHVLRLGLPLSLSHLAQISITLTDTVMLGRYSVEALAGQVLGGMLFFVVFIVGSGFALAVMPLVAHATAQDDAAQIRRVTRMGMWMSVVYGAVMLPLLLWAQPVFLALGQPEEVAQVAAVYLWIAGWALLPSLLVMALKSYLSALERTQIVLWVTVAAVVLNVGVNYLLIFGHFGFPEMGVRGAAVASLAVSVASFLALGLYVMVLHPAHGVFARLWRPDWAALVQVVRLGLPIGLTNLAESGLFAASTIMMGWLGKIPLAAHGIALELVSVTFMMHLGLANAATIRAGQALGRRDGLGLREGALAAVGLSAVVALLAMMAFFAVPEVLTGLFLGADVPDRVQVLRIAVWLMAAAALFQFFDGAQVMALGLLRGVQDSVAPMIIAVVCYWLIGIPASYVMGFVLGYGGIGIWVGLALGLACASTCLLVRFWGWSGRIATG